MIETKKTSKKTVLLIIGLLCIVSIGISYAFWRITLAQTGSNRISTSCFDVSFTEDSEAIQLEKAYPILDEEGIKGTPYTFTLTNNCEELASYQINLEVLNETTLDSQYIKVYLDSSSPSILTNLNMTSKTLSEAKEAYVLDAGYFEPNESKTFNLRIWMDENTPAIEETINKAFASKITITTSYLKNKPSDYEMCVMKYGEDSIQCSILASVDTTGKCAEVEEDGTVNLNKNYENEEVNEGNMQTIMADLIESEEGYVCSAPDDYGNSYYYRGAVENNWVKFADSYWRIIRVNGDGSIRLLYNGEASVIDALDPEVKAQVLANGYDDSSTNYTTVGESDFNSSYSDNAYVGYMYGNRDGIVEGDQTDSANHNATATRYYAQEYTYDVETDRFTLKDPVALLGTEVTEDYVGWYTMRSSSSTSSSSYVYKVTSVTPSDGSSAAEVGVHLVTYGTTSKEKAQENINDSTIKEYIDNWYEEKFLNTEYESYLSDTLFCNDRSIPINENFELEGYQITNTGYGLNGTLYRGLGDPGWFMMPSLSPDEPAYQIYGRYTMNPTLKCQEQNDRFTVNDEKVGNGALTYPVSLITVDEIYLAGGSSLSSNNGYYLYNGDYYWTLSPFNFFFGGSFTSVRSVTDDGNSFDNYVNISLGVRPVINLKADSLKLGSGTALDPYTV